MKSIRFRGLLIAMICWVSGYLPGVQAATYPERPVTMLVGYPAGGIVDVAARGLVETARDYFPKPIMVVNKPGGASAIATAELIQAAPDGYTLCMVFSPTVCIQPHLSLLPYKGPNDLQPVINTVVSPIVFAVGASSPWMTMKEVLDYARLNPGKVRVGYSGIGSHGHIGFEDLKKKARIDMADVPFEGGPPLTAALLGGHIEAYNGAPGNLMGHIKAGKVRALACFEHRRIPQLPETPTLRELGYDVVRVGARLFVAAPKRTSKSVVDTLYTSFKKAVLTESFQRLAIENVFVLECMGPDELSKELEREYAFYGSLIKSLNIK